MLCAQVVIITAITTVITLASANASAELVVIVNPKNALSALTSEQVANIYLGKTNAFPDGSSLAAADLSEGAPHRDEFYATVTDRTAPQVKAVRARLIFTGKGTPPREFGTAADVKHYVASNPSAVGYIEKSALDSTVKAVLTVQ